MARSGTGIIDKGALDHPTIRHERIYTFKQARDTHEAIRLTCVARVRVREISVGTFSAVQE